MVKTTGKAEKLGSAAAGAVALAGSRDALCVEVADAFTGAVVKVFDDIPNRTQIGDFFTDAMTLVDKGTEAAGWEPRERAAGILRVGGYLLLNLSRQFAPLADEEGNTKA